jgi:predicted nucleic acid-binding protein
MSWHLFDTNVLLAVMLPHREHHAAAAKRFVASKKQGKAAICIHTLAEAYSILSGKIGIPAKQAHALLQQNLVHVTVLAFEAQDHPNALERMVSLGIGGGGIYDALLAEVALRRNCQRLYTNNLKHFLRLGEVVAAMTQEP